MNTTQETVSKVTSKIAPAWPLKNLVAVNPYLGFADTPFQETSQLFGQAFGSQITMSLDYYLRLFRNKSISMDAIERSLRLHGVNMNAQEFVRECDGHLHHGTQTSHPQVQTMAAIASLLTRKNWGEFLNGKVSSWAAAYFDEFQASWSSIDRQASLFGSWKNEVKHDKSYRIAGLKSFSTVISDLPDDDMKAAELILDSFNIEDKRRELYLSRLLFDLIGWSSYIAGQDWNNGLYKSKSTHLNSFLCILLAVEYGLYHSIGPKEIEPVWKASLKEELTENPAQQLQLIFQDALDVTYQQKLNEKFLNRKPVSLDSRPKLQALFCIDVRSEVYRRHLERLDPMIETKGYAGFFGIPLKYIPIGAENGKNQCPVLLPAGPIVKETTLSNQLKTVEKRRVNSHQFFRSFKAFKSGPVSSFGFVSPLGLAYLPKLISDSFGFTRPVVNPDKLGHTKKSWKERNVDLSSISLNDKINMAAGALNSMGFNGRFAPVVLITGHGSTSVNNPHAAGLECGACGGHAGEVNARSAAEIFNDLEVRNGLKERGIIIPTDTVFVSCLHNTTTDELEILDQNKVNSLQPELFRWILSHLKTASNTARMERSIRLNISHIGINKKIMKRSNDWSQIRPEWGLAGCSSFIIADRKNTRGVDLEGKAFLHDYNWKEDENGAILEGIITAPMVVTSWINLQYYASTVDPSKFGAGNKTLHNITSGVGVIEGSTGDLKIGLPLQSIHNGKDFEHPPHRLTVIIQSSTEIINKILTKHSSVKALCDNGWIHLLTMNDNGVLSRRYLGGLTWEEEQKSGPNENNKQKKIVTV